MHPEQAELAEFTGEVADRKGAVLEPLTDVRAQAFGAEIANGVDDRALLVVDQPVEAEEFSDRFRRTHVVHHLFLDDARDVTRYLHYGSWRNDTRRRPGR